MWNTPENDREAGFFRGDLGSCVQYALAGSSPVSRTKALKHNSFKAFFVSSPLAFSPLERT